MDVLPTAITRHDANRLLIQWSDGVQLQYSPPQLRKACPCATCREKKSDMKSSDDAQATKSLPVLSMSEARPLSIERMRPVGNYAYNIAFSDGHDSGIFSFDFLRQLGDPT